MIAVLRAQLAAVRVQVESLHAQIVAMEEAMMDQTSSSPKTCTHVSMTNVGTFGAPAYQCDTCHEMVLRDP